MSKLREDLRVGGLGAAAGLFSISIALLIARIDAYYAYLSWLKEETHYSTYDKGVEDLSWIPVSCGHILLSVVASHLVHRYLTVRSPFLLWQIISITSLLGWGLTFVLAVSMGCLVRGDLYPLEHAVNSTTLGFITKYASAVFAGNVVYGSLIQASVRQYTEHLHLD
jgi:hypothetical protein